MKNALVVIISFLSCAFFCVRGAFFSAFPITALSHGAGIEQGVKNECYSEAYLYKSSSGCKVVSLNGFGGDFFCNVGSGGLLSAIKSVKGERFFVPSEVAVSGGLSFEELRDFFVARLNARAVFCESASGVYNEYYYSSAIKNCAVINGKRVNLQIGKTNAGISVASPVAFGSY